MKLDEETQIRMHIVFDHLADKGMVDSPNGPFAKKMRALAEKKELTGEEINEVLGRAEGVVALNKKLLDAEKKTTSDRALLTALVLLNENRDELLRKLDDVLPPSIDSIQLKVAKAAQDLLILIEAKRHDA